jgi:hypothetical protein
MKIGKQIIIQHKIDSKLINKSFNELQHKISYRIRHIVKLHLPNNILPIFNIINIPLVY